MNGSFVLGSGATANSTGWPIPGLPLSLPDVNPEPLTVTVLPPDVGPSTGLSEDTVGAAS